MCCSKGVEALVKSEYKLKNTVSIYNFLNSNKALSNTPNPFDFQYIIAVGRFEPLKQFDKLIEAYSQSNLPKKNIKLVLVGSGKTLNSCKKRVRDLDLYDNIVFTGSTTKPYNYIQHALFLVLCSKYEGLPMVLLEALYNEVPVVSFDLIAGPNEIIIPNKNGILVENQNFDALVKAINTMEEDKEFYKNCKTASKNSIKKFSKTVVEKEWLNVLKID